MRIESSNVVEYRHAGEMLSSYQERRAKLWGPPPKRIRYIPEAPPPPPPPPPPPQPVGRPWPKPDPSASENIIRATCAHFGITKDQLLAKDRKHFLVRMRWVAMYLCRALTSNSMPYIARRMGGRDHTTVLYAVIKTKKLMNSDPTFAADVAAVEALLLRGPAEANV